ncbi:UNVERIFIED_CONTAM: hypothetical protein FKN15_002976, partial [Acipenser sinensis]
VFCNRTFDNYACWPDSLVGSVVHVPCPPYLPWYERVPSGHVYWTIMENGSWLLLENSSLPWCDFTECLEDSSVQHEMTAAGCRVAQVLMQYCIGASYYWLLVEGLYLQAILSLSSWAENKYFRYYIMLGWAPWVLVKYLHENEECWSQNISMRIWWIIRAPAMAAVLINSVIFIHAIVLLLLQFNANKLTYTDTKYRLAKSTLTLIPLLGVHEILFVFITDETAVGLLRNVKLTFELLLSSFQVLSLYLYCMLLFGHI